MTFKILVPLAATLVLGAGMAFAQDAPPPPRDGGQGGAWDHHMRMDPKMMAEHHKEMCTGMYAHAVGGLAALEVELNLTAAQKPLFAHWKEAVLASAKEGSDACQAMKPPHEKHSLVDAMKMHEKMLAARLQALRSQMPALEALNAALDERQQHVLERAAMMAMHHMREHMGHGEHGMGPHDGMGHGMPPADGPH